MDISAHSQSDQQQSAVHFLDYWQVLYARKEIVIAVVLLVTLTGIVITRQMPRVYASSVRIQLERENPHPTADIISPILNPRVDPFFLATQFEIIKSYPVMERVVKELGLDREMGVAYGWRESGSENSVLERTVGLVRGRTDISIVRDTNLVDIRVRMDRPERPDGEALKVAVSIANTIAKVYEVHTKEENKRLIEAGLSALKEEADLLGRQITKAEDQFYAFQIKHGITMVSDFDSGLTAIRNQIQGVTADCNRTQIIATMKKARYERVVELEPDEAAIMIPILIGADNTLSTLIGSKEGIEINMTRLRESGLGTAHPDLVQLTATLAEIDNRIKQRVKDIKMGLKLDFEQAQSEHDLYTAHLAELENKLRELSGGVIIEFKNLQSSLVALKDRKIALERVIDIQRIDARIPTTNVRIIQAAKVPEHPAPISPNFPVNVTLSFVVGLAFGVALAFFVEYLDTTVKSVDDVEKHLASTIVGVVPDKVRILTAANRNAGHSEIYRVLRMNLKSSKKLADGKLLMITSASAGEGKSTISFNLAYVCAEVGEKTLILDADLHRPVQHKILDLSGEVGLSNVIVGEATLDSAIQHTNIPNLDILPSGQMSRFSVIGLVDTDEMRNLIVELKQRYDRIIMDTPPIIGVSDTAPLVRLADGVVQVIHHRKYPRGLCKRARDLIVGMGGNLLGIILNNVEAAHDASSYYYKYQYYYYYYNTEEEESAYKKKPNRRRRRSDTIDDAKTVNADDYKKP